MDNNKKIRYTCSLCSHFEPNKGECRVLQQTTFSQNHEAATECHTAGRFLRDMNVQYSYFNIIDENDNMNSGFIEDLSRLQRDPNGVPLFVLTKRGIERALPAYSGLELTSNHLLGVKREYTYQGQRELIYEIGIDLARTVCEARGVELVVLDSEIDSTGFDEYKNPYLIYRR